MKTGKQEKRLLLTLFWVFFKISAMVVGGGYAIIAASEEYFVRRKKLISHDEMLDSVAVTQSVPGILACNSAVIIGSKISGLPGALAALAGAFLPPVIIITLLGYILNLVPGLIEHPKVQKGFSGVIAAVTAIVLFSVLRTAAGSKNGMPGIIIAIASFAALTVFKVSPVYVLLGAVGLGIILQLAETLLLYRKGDRT